VESTLDEVVWVQIEDGEPGLIVSLYDAFGQPSEEDMAVWAVVVDRYSMLHKLKIDELDYDVRLN